MRPMNSQKILVPLTGLAALVLAFYRYGWAGVAVVTGGIVMFLLLHFTRTMTVLKRASDRPIGYVASAVMLNAKLKPGVTLLHVVAMTRSLGELKTPKEQQPETYRWTDGGLSYVEGIFLNGKLQSWALTRPPAEDEAAAGGH
ncbi:MULTISPECIES: glycerate kinase [unclassified Variovorax]|uniref:glycerate kinase n=1 Tax=unclassified Variovorax TaxID=663243 RepID=UPI002575B677|nr:MULTISPECIES: glycerate kinase [unclassified Variovorax]MDM0090668.1 glycerate kinase [Variovorax sp. J22G40]MDM0149330.1 glycerate kinase [Variovorax sp. J2P1-31]